MNKVNKKEYFNKVECSKLVRLVPIDPYGAKEGFEQYLEVYPKDYYAKIVYASLLISLGKFEYAGQVIDEVEDGFLRNGHLIKKSQRQIDNEKDVAFCRVRLLSYTNQLEELYKFVLLHKKLLSSLNMYDFVLFYCKSRLGILDLSRDEGSSYLYRQIIDYSEEDMLQHIKDHLSDYNSSMTEPDPNVFTPDFPIEMVIKELKNIIPNEKKICYGIIDNIYVFRYDGCGRDSNRLTNYFKVICFNNSSNIITMCPVYGCEKIPYIDLNYLACHEDVSSKIKVLSQRDKFNRRYGLK